ncbi:histidine kinase [Streptomyces sp. ST2-7A]|uniref:sensor histidine kinase n=1 Tax=Streptomyces sp. ST2-7A TaxID=2907214 RepID=UPI001F3DCAEA|nr:histidine kinase [Streptomyces sp. ST2-7A]MCE7080875.1 histidine kinase [Streptomyces sp. ST2-7A]
MTRRWPTLEPLAPVRRFRRSSGGVRFHQYTRWAIYFFAFAEVGLILLWLVGMGPGVGPLPAVLLLGTGGAHAAVNLMLSRDGLNHYLGREPRPDRLFALFAVLTLLGLLVGVLLLRTGALPEDAAVAMVWFPMFFTGPALLVRSVSVGSTWSAVAVAAAILGALAGGVSPEMVVPLLFTAVFCTSFFGFTYRTSAWSLRVVDELEASRETRARLAVAEERLRFGRDMHDVLGRNLSVIALKSELAAQLARRGADAAVDQMIEVERIARESQREMRAVLRGYRDTDLFAELAGARGVLEAAGTECRVEPADPRRLPELSEAVGAALGWVVREGATNVLRHADAAHCAIAVRGGRDGTVEVEMRNDGVADRPGTGDGRGSGLRGLRERLTPLGGTLEAGPDGTDGGWRLAARVPAAAVSDEDPRGDGDDRDGDATGGGEGAGGEGGAPGAGGRWSGRGGKNGERGTRGEPGEPEKRSEA